jgi:hypothetical protein
MKFSAARETCEEWVILHWEYSCSDEEVTDKLGEDVRPAKCMFARVEHFFWQLACKSCGQETPAIIEAHKISSKLYVFHSWFLAARGSNYFPYNYIRSGKLNFRSNLYNSPLTFSWMTSYDVKLLQFNRALLFSFLELFCFFWNFIKSKFFFSAKERFALFFFWRRLW